MALGQQELGLRIKEARDAAGLTQPQLAQKIGVEHPQSISNYERGVTEVPTRRLRKIAEVTGKPMSFFVQEESAAAAQVQGTLELAVEALLNRINSERDERTTMDGAILARLDAIEEQLRLLAVAAGADVGP